MKLSRFSRGGAPIAVLILGLGLSLPGLAVVHSSEKGSPGNSGFTQPSPSGPQAGLPAPDKAYAPDEALVIFKAKTDADSRRNVVRGLGDRVSAVLENLPHMAVVELKSGRSVPKAIEAYQADPRVEHAQPNYTYQAMKTPNDPEFDQLWGLENTGQTVDGDAGTEGMDIGAPSAWEAQTDCTGVPVAVVDTGINYEHADLAANMWTGDSNHGRDFVGDTNDPDPMAEGGATHGTHVAGTIAAVGDNGTGTTGVCWQGEIMSVRVLGPSGRGYTSDIIEGVEYAVENGARVINLSLGGSSYDEAFKDALDNARDNGVLVTASAGNSGTDNDEDPVYPCSYSLDNVICAAALDQNYDLADFSNYGEETVDVGAPGTNIQSSYPGPTVAGAFDEWSLDPEWAVDSTCGRIDILVNPEDWCGGADYAGNLDSRAYRSFDLTSDALLGAGYHYYLDLALGHSKDTFEAGHFAGTGDPFDHDPAIDYQASGAMDTDGFNYHPTVALTECLGSECSIAYRLDTSRSRSDNGPAVALFDLQKVTAGAEETAILDGTSMAAPHVAGIAALGWAYKPGSSYAEIRDAVLQGGDAVSSLSGLTATGRAVDAWGTLQKLE